jgi:hypothetical protein
MSRRRVFWGLALLVLGTLLLLQELDILRVNVWGLLIPLILIGLGILVVWESSHRSQTSRTERVTIPHQGAERGRLRIRHGAGPLTLSSGAGPTYLLTGQFAGGIAYRTGRDQDIYTLDMHAPSSSPAQFIFAWPFFSNGGRIWDVRLNPTIVYALDIDGGANLVQLDLTHLLVSELRVKTGASSAEIGLPANAGYTRVFVQAGAASVQIEVPAQVAARIHTRGDLSGMTIDRSRFPQIGNVYQSPDYDTAPNRVDIEAQVDVGSLEIR